MEGYHKSVIISSPNNTFLHLHVYSYAVIILVFSIKQEYIKKNNLYFDLKTFENCPILYINFHIM